MNNRWMTVGCVIALCLFILPINLAPDQILATDINREFFPELDSELITELNTGYYSDLKSYLDMNKNATELISSRTKSTKTYQLPNGNFRAMLSAVDIHYEDESGRLHDIVTKLIDESSLESEEAPISKAFSQSMLQKNMFANNLNSLNESDSLYRAIHVPFNIEFPEKITNGFSFETNSERITLLPLNALSSIGKRIGDDYILYENVWNQTDAILKLLKNGVGKEIKLKGLDSPTYFSFQLLSDEPDEKNKELIIEPAMLIDANGITREVKQNIRHESNETYLDMEIDVDGMVFPVSVITSVITRSIIYEYSKYEYRRFGIREEVNARYNPLIGVERSRGIDPRTGFIDDYILTSEGLISFDLNVIPNQAVVKGVTLVGNFPKLLGRVIENKIPFNTYSSTNLVEIVQYWADRKNMHTISYFKFGSSSLAKRYDWRDAYLIVEYENPIAKFEYIYDSSGQLIETHSVNAGRVISEYEYDDNGNLISRR